MHLRKNQRGMTAIGWAFVLILIGFTAVVIMKLFPIYMESFKIDSALESLAHDPEVMKGDTYLVRKRFVARMNIEDVDRFNDVNIKDYLTVKKADGKKTIIVKYQAQSHLFGNLTIVADFDKQVSGN